MEYSSKNQSILSFSVSISTVCDCVCVCVCVCLDAIPFFFCADFGACLVQFHPLN